MARITHPRPVAGRTTAFGIEFVDGVAQVDVLHPERRAALLLHRYVIDERPDLEEQTVEQLRAELEGYGYDVKKSWRKPELIERIAQHLELNAVQFDESSEASASSPSFADQVDAAMRQADEKLIAQHTATTED